MSHRLPWCYREDVRREGQRWITPASHGGVNCGQLRPGSLTVGSRCKKRITQENRTLEEEAWFSPESRSSAKLRSPGQLRGGRLLKGCRFSGWLA